MSTRSESVGTKPEDNHIEHVSSGQATLAEGKSGSGPENPVTDGKRELLEADAYEHLGYSYPTWRKWMILTVMFCIQISINLNASLWAPWSEELGRWPTQQLSLLLVNLWQFPCAWAPGLRRAAPPAAASPSACWPTCGPPDDQEYAVAWLVLSSVGGSVVGGFVQAYHHPRDLRWIFFTQLLAGAAVQVAHFVLVPETRATILLDREARKRRKRGEDVWGPNEVRSRRMNLREVLTVWARPFYMLITEPIVAWLSAVSGFSDNLIFIFLQGFQPVYKQWGFAILRYRLLVGYIIAYLSFLPSIHWFRQRRRKHGSDSVSPEARLWWLRYVILLEPIGLIGFAWTSLGPPRVHWIAPMIFSSLVGIANYSIYQSSIDYTVAAYGVYVASATGGNDFARDFLSGIAAIYSAPMYEGFGKYSVEWASTLLAIVAVFVTTPVFYFYNHGAEIRKRSKFAAEIARAREEGRGGRPRNEGGEPALPGHEKA
ncbi:polyamine transporter 4 [Xylariomycetidae sp. FL0641]|nr:polyamine transporter 4 [Xylariomycetidae sp. FL0641]